MMPSLADGADSRKFRFVAIQAQDGKANQITRRLARSHAVKHALEDKRRQQRTSGEHFHVTFSKDRAKRSVSKRVRTRDLPASISILYASVLDPFQTLAVDSTRLQILLSNYKARQAPEPVFSIAEGLVFQSFHVVFKTGLVDPALVNAVMLSLVFAVNGGSIDRECLGYQGQAMKHLHERMDHLDEATSESTIGAILLLAGVEARLGMKHRVQLHIGAVHSLLQLSRKKDVPLTGGIKRAIFWQDMNCSVLAGSNRIVDHRTFAELQWTRDTFSPTFFRLPSGFQKLSHLYTEELIEVLEDIHALQCIRDVPNPLKGDVMLMAQINNHIASIQSRLVSMPQRLSVITECCRLAAYICSVMLCCTIWCALAVPSHIASQLLHVLQTTKDNPLWDDHPELLLWLLYMGGAFVPAGNIRSEYVALIRSDHAVRLESLYGSSPELLDILQQFIWSERAFKSPIETLWRESLT